jgi:16S rRNA processing protein RimM
MGQIGAPYGVQGWVKVKTFTEMLDGLLDYRVWQIGKQGQWRDVQVEDASTHGQSLVAKLAGCNDRDAAFALRGQEISVFRDEMPDPAAGEYYWEDLIGLAVINRQGMALGEVRQLIETGAHDVLVVKNDKEHLIPFVDVYVLNVDLARGRIEVDWGLDY